MKDKQYKILSLHAENIKKLKVVDITTDPKSSTVIISGANGNGKSSVLDCIEMACRGGDTLPDMPIRRGQEKGNIELNLGDLIIKRTFTEKGSYLFVESADGARYPQPQAMLDKMLGLIAFDPLEFTRLKPKDQYETIKALVDLKEVEALEGKIKADEEARTTAGRQVKELTAQVAGMVVPEDTPEEPIDVSAKSAEIIRAKENYAEFISLGNKISNNDRSIARAQEEIKNLQWQIEELGKDTEVAIARREEIQKTTPDTEQFKVLETEIQNATSINAAVANRVLRKTKEADLATWTKQHADLEKAIIAGREKKAEMIADAKMPVKGLSLEEGTVLYKDIPLAQASTAEQIRVSTAIAMASNPSLRVIRIKDASLLDDDSLDVIKSMAEKNDFQVWLEIVSSDDPMAVIIEDGEVKEHEKKVQRKKG